MSKLFGSKLRYLRHKRKLKQTALAGLLTGISQSYLSLLESGQKPPSLDVAVQIADFFRTTTDYLLRDEVPIDRTHRLDIGSLDVLSSRRTQATLGQKVRTLRQRFQWTQAQLAAKLDLATHASISQIESGKKQPSLELLVRLADCLGVTTDYLLRDYLDADIPRLPSE